MKADSFVVIQSWMCVELELKGNDLLIFALIHGFSQDGESRFSGSRSYIANTFNISLPTVDKSIKNLINKNLIQQHRIEKNGVVFNEYNSLWGIKKLYGPCKETLHNNIDNNIDNNNFNKLKLNNKIQEPEFNFGKSKPKKENLYQRYINLILAKTDNFELRQLLVDWLNMVLEKYKSRNKILYANVFKGKLNMLDKYDIRDWKAIIEYNLQKGYEGFYPIHQIFKQTSPDGLEESPTMTDYDRIELDRITEERKRNGLRTSF